MDEEEKYIIARWAYSIGMDYIDDIEYNELERNIKARGLLEEYTERGWSKDPCPYELLKKYNLDELIVPIIYSYSTESIESLNSMELVEQYLRNVNETTRLSYKLDGFNLRLNYYNGRLVLVSLRNRNKGKVTELTSIFPLFKQTIEMQGKVLIVGELYLKNSKLEVYKNLRGIISQRNGVSTAIANGDMEFLSYRCYNIYSNELENSQEDKYKLLQQLGFPTAKSLIVKDYATILKGIDILGKQKNNYDAPTDGLVVENSSMQFALRVGEWEESINKSYVTGYTVNRGMYGLSLLCAIRPIVLENKTVSEINVTNIQTIIDNNLRIGSPIAFVDRSAVNSVIETIKTKELQDQYEGNYDAYREDINSLQ